MKGIKQDWHAGCYLTGQEKQVPASPAARHNNSAARVTQIRRHNNNPGGSRHTAPDRTTTTASSARPLGPGRRDSTPTTTTAATEAPEDTGRDAPAHTPTNNNNGPSQAHPWKQQQHAGGRQTHCRRGWIIVLNTRRSPTGSANKDNNTACLTSLVTVVRIQGDVPSRRRTSSTDAATLLEGEAIRPPPSTSGDRTARVGRYASPRGSATLTALRLSRAFSALRVDIAACSKDLPVFCRVPARA